MTESPSPPHPSSRPIIGVFDSGFGGLTVLDALTRALPGADFLYLGDTARLPYGSKSPETITRYTAAAIRLLQSRGAQLVVIACNTASALALPSLKRTATLPLIGVIEAGAAEAARILARSHPPAPSCTSPARAESPQTPAPPTLLVLATAATVCSHAYRIACAVYGLSVYEKACPLLVPLVEEGWTDHSITAQTADIYLREALQDLRDSHAETGTAISSDLLARDGLLPANQPSRAPWEPVAILLGCTHYPLLRPLLERTVASVMRPIPIIDAAAATAAQVQSLLPGLSSTGEPTLTFLATDSPAKFQHLGQLFLHRPIPHVELVTLEP